MTAAHREKKIFILKERHFLNRRRFESLLIIKKYCLLLKNIVNY